RVLRVVQVVVMDGHVDTRGRLGSTVDGLVDLEPELAGVDRVALVGDVGEPRLRGAGRGIEARGDAALRCRVDDALLGGEEVGAAVDRRRTDRVAAPYELAHDPGRRLRPVRDVRDGEVLADADHLASGVEA